MSIYSIPPLICALISFILGVLAYLKNRKSLINIVFFFLCFTVFWWQINWSILFSIKTKELTLFIIKICYSGIIFIPVTCYHFVVQFLKISKKERNYLRIAYFIGLIFVFLLWFSKFYINGYYNYKWGFYPKANFLHFVYLGGVVLLVIRGFILLLSSLKENRTFALRYNQIKYTLLAFLIFTFASFDFIVNYGFGFYPLWFIPAIISLCIFAYAILKYHLLDISITLTRAAIFAIVYFPVNFIPFWIAPKLIHTPLWWLPILLMGVLATVGIFTYNSLRKRAESFLRREQLAYQEKLLQLSSSMMLIKEIDKLIRAIVFSVVDIVKVDWAGIYLKDEKEPERFLPKVSGLRLQVSGKSF